MKKLALIVAIIGVLFSALSLWVAVPVAVGVICIGAAVVIGNAVTD